MSFELRPAVREGLPLLIGLSGPTGSGKTYSALRMAAGLAGGERFAVIDTENGRALHYANEFDFDHGALEPPFTPERYAEAIQAADDAGYPVIVVDSASHEHAGEGGLLDMHDDKLDKMAGDNFSKRQAVTMLAWVEPKQQHKRMVNKLLRTKAHVILCFRAEEKVEMVKGDRGETVIRPKRSLTGSQDGWIPIAEKSLPYELTLSLLVTPDNPGVPKPIKLQQQHRLIVPLDKPLSEETGEALGAWASGVKSETEAKITDLSTELLDLADALGTRDLVTAAIQKNRRNGTTKHIAWLERQIATARPKADAKAQGESEADVPVEAPVPVGALTGASDAAQPDLSEGQAA